MGRDAPPSQQPKRQDDAGVNIPPIPDNFDEINQLSYEGMKALLKDKNKLKLFVSNLGYQKNITELIDQVENANLKTAQKKMEMDKKRQGKANDVQGKVAELVKLQKRVDELILLQNQMNAKHQPKYIIRQFNQLLKEGDEQADDDLTEFIDDDQDEKSLKKFLKSMLKKRELYHIRKQKRDQFQAKYGAH